MSLSRRPSAVAGPGTNGRLGALDALGALEDLTRRFDILALRPPSAAADESARLQRHEVMQAQLLAWCQALAAPAPAAQAWPAVGPAGLPRLAVGCLLSDTGPEPAAAPALPVAFADAFARQIDGSLRLEALPGRAAGLAWRLRLKLHEAMLWRARQPSDPWDAGWLLTSTAARQHSAWVWRPRRATLLLADATEATEATETDTASLHDCLAALGQRQAQFRHRVRWLWVGGAASQAETAASRPRGASTSLTSLTLLETTG